MQQLANDNAALFRAWMSRAAADLAERPCFVGRAHGHSEEAVAEALSKAWSVGSGDPAYFDSYAHLINWLKQTARWRHIDRFRERLRRRFVRVSPSSAALTSPPDGEGWTAEDVEHLWDCLRRLPRDERELLLASYFDGLTDAEVGRRLFGATATPRALGLRVWRLRQAALAHLRCLLREEGIGPR